MKLTTFHFCGINKCCCSRPKTICKNLFFSPKSQVLEEHETIIQSCVLKASMVKSPFISLIDPQPTSWLTLNGHLNWTLTRHSINVSIALVWHSIDSWLIVSRVSTNWYVLISLTHNGMTAKMSWLSTDYWPRCCSNVKRVSTEVSIKFPLNVNQGYWSILNCGCL